MLLGCDCKGAGVNLGPLQSIPEPTVLEAPTGDSFNDSDDDLLFPPAHAIVAGTKANVAVVEKRIAEAAKKKKAKDAEEKMQALMQYKHIDTAIFKGETGDVFGYEHQEFIDINKALDDEVLTEILKGEKCKINYIFAKRDRVSKA